MVLLEGASHAQRGDSVEIAAQILDRLLELGPGRIRLSGIEDLEDATHLSNRNRRDTFSKAIVGLIRGSAQAREELQESIRMSRWRARRLSKLVTNKEVVDRVANQILGRRDDRSQFFWRVAPVDHFISRKGQRLGQLNDLETNLNSKVGAPHLVFFELSGDAEEAGGAGRRDRLSFNR